MAKASLKAAVYMLLSFMLALLTDVRGNAGLRAASAGQVTPYLERYSVYQIGASDIVLSLSGEALPEPEVSFSGACVTVTLPNTGIKDKNRLTASGAPAAPLILGMTAECIPRSGQPSTDTVISINVSKPLRLHSKSGGAVRHILRFAAQGSPPPQLPDTASKSEFMEFQRKHNLPDFSKVKLDNLDIRDIDLIALFRLTADALNKSIIIDPSVPSAQISLALHDVPADNIFNYLMKTYGLSCYQLNENTIVIGTRDGLSRLSGEEETRAFDIAYADPSSIIAPLASLTHIPAENFVADARLRTLYVTSNPWKLNEAAKIIRNMDRPGRQVMIRARIFEFSEGSSREIETALNAVYKHWWFSYSGRSGGRGGYAWDNNTERSFTGLPSGYPLPGMTNLLAPMDGLWREFDAAFSALEASGKGRTLASPSVIAIDGQEAQIMLTEDYPYISSRDDAGNPTWSSETIGPQLTLTPRVGRDGMVDIQLSVVTGEVIEMITGSTGEQMPRTSTRSVKTRIRVRDGEPFVVGGLFHEAAAKRTAGLPVIGQIPLIKELFTYRYEERSRTQVVIIVIPYILNMS